MVPRGFTACIKGNHFVFYHIRIPNICGMYVLLTCFYASKQPYCSKMYLPVL